MFKQIICRKVNTTLIFKISFIPTNYKCIVTKNYTISTYKKPERVCVFMNDQSNSFSGCPLCKTKIFFPHSKSEELFSRITA